MYTIENKEDGSVINLTEAEAVNTYGPRLNDMLAGIDATLEVVNAEADVHGEDDFAFMSDCWMDEDLL